MNGEKILWTGRQNMKAALMSAIINFFLLAAAVWLLVNRNNLAETWENLEKRSGCRIFSVHAVSVSGACCDICDGVFRFCH